MTRKLLLSGAMLALTATSASAAGLDLAWSACPTFGGTQNVNFDCVHDTYPNMYGIFQVPIVVDSVVAMDWVMDLAVESASLPPFWHMEVGDCNGDYVYGGGFGLSSFKPISGCGTGSQVIATWNTESIASSQGYLDAGRPTVPPGANRARILCAISRPGHLPIRLNPANKYYGFGMYFSTQNATENGIGTCDGCPTPACIVWNTTKLIPTTRDPYVLEGPGLVGNAAAINGGSSSCLATPARKKTWGQIKALYR